ncbi:Ig-like domain-containing protein, partial [Morganella morganii]
MHQNFATVSKLLNVVTVTGVAAGTANITVTSEDGSKTAKCVVTVT